MRRAKVDSNQKEIVSAFREMGCTVQHLHTVGMGCPDIVVGLHGVNLLVEIKDGSLPPSGRKLTRDEQGWHNLWRGQVCVIESVADAANLVLEVNMNNEKTINRSKGKLVDDPCPVCGYKLVRNDEGEEWCIHPLCDYGIEILRSGTVSRVEKNVQSK